jgi:hypothetical protein
MPDSYKVRVALLLFAVLGLLAAGCGSTATNDYRTKVASVQQRYQGQLTNLTSRVTADLTAQRPSKAVTDLDQFAATVGRFADELAAIKPPADKQALAAQLVGAYRLLGKAGRDLRTAVVNKDQTGLQRALGEFTSASESESAAVDAFNAAH